MSYCVVVVFVSLYFKTTAPHEICPEYVVSSVRCGEETDLKTIQKEYGDFVAVSRSGEVAVADEESGRERERYKIPYGAVLKKGHEAAVDAGEIVANWDPHTHPIVTEVEGKVVFENMVEGVTIRRLTD